MISTSGQGTRRYRIAALAVLLACGFLTAEILACSIWITSAFAANDNGQGGGPGGKGGGNGGAKGGGDGGGNNGGGNNGGGNNGGGNSGGGNGGGNNGGGNNGGGNSGGGNNGGGNGGGSGGGNSGNGNSGGNGNANGGTSGNANSAVSAAERAPSTETPETEIEDPNSALSLREAGAIRPLGDLFKVAEQQLSGEVIDAKLVGTAVKGWTYDLRVVTKDGHVRQARYDAATLDLRSLDGQPIE